MGCKYDYSDTCLWFEVAPTNTSKAVEIAAQINKPDFKCSETCAGFETGENNYCRWHNVEYFGECPDCMKEIDAAMDAKREEQE